MKNKLLTILGIMSFSLCSCGVTRTIFTFEEGQERIQKIIENESEAFNNIENYSFETKYINQESDYVFNQSSSGWVDCKNYKAFFTFYYYQNSDRENYVYYEYDQATGYLWRYNSYNYTDEKTKLIELNIKDETYVKEYLFECSRNYSKIHEGRYKYNLHNLCIDEIENFNFYIDGEIKDDVLNIEIYEKVEGLPEEYHGPDMIYSEILGYEIPYVHHFYTRNERKVKTRNYLPEYVYYNNQYAVYGGDEENGYYPLFYGVEIESTYEYNTSIVPHELNSSDYKLI